MKIFDSFDQPRSPIRSDNQNSADKSVKKGATSRETKIDKKNEMREKNRLSPAEAREKIKAHFNGNDVSEISNKAQMKKASVQKIGEFNEHEDDEIEPKQLATFTNEPDNPVTVEKLKGALKSGAINFSEKERMALTEILK